MKWIILVIFLVGCTSYSKQSGEARWCLLCWEIEVESEVSKDVIKKEKCKGESS